MMSEWADLRPSILAEIYFGVVTGAFPATATGDSKIEDTVALPSPCVAPIVFVGPGTGAVRWFSATGMATN